MMKNPSHPGPFIRRQVLEPLGVGVSRAAAVLQVRRATLSDLLNAKSALSADMALRIEKAFGVSMDMLLRMQAAFDGARARREGARLKINRYAA